MFTGVKFFYSPFRSDGPARNGHDALPFMSSVGDISSSLGLGLQDVRSTSAKALIALRCRTRSPLSAVGEEDRENRSTAASLHATANADGSTMFRDDALAYPESEVP
jgi:hypothetical protein